jgi:predicted Zn-dependent peptidase
MKPIAALALSALALMPALGATASPASPAKAVAAPGARITEAHLPNGLTILAMPIPHSTVVTMHTWVKAGSRDEKPGITGIAHLFEHMMFRPVAKGAKSYYDQAAALGLEYNASTRFNATDYYDTFAPDQLSKVVAMEATRFKQMHVTDQMLDLEREAVRSEYSTKFDASPMIDLWFWIYRYAFPNHPYRWHIVGYREDLDRIKATDANRFYAANYTPNNAIVVVAGAIDAKKAIAEVSRAFGPWKRGPAKPAWKVPVPMGKAPVEGEGKLGAPSKYMLIGYRVPERTAPDRLAQDLAEYILFEGKDGLVPKRLLDDTHVAGVADGFNTGYDIGLAKLLVLPNPGVSRARIQDEIVRAIAGFDKLSAADFEAYRQAYAVQLRESQLKSHGVTSALGRAWAYDGDYRVALTDPAAVLTVPRKAVSAVVHRTYTPANRVTVVTP